MPRIEAMVFVPPRQFGTYHIPALELFGTKLKGVPPNGIYVLPSVSVGALMDVMFAPITTMHAPAGCVYGPITKLALLEVNC